MSKTIAAVLSAGKGSRMQSSLPKVLHLLNNKPLLNWSLDAFSNSHCEEIIVVVSPQQDQVINAVKDYKSQCLKPVHICFQNQPKGTGDAVKCAVNIINESDPSTQICVGFGDTPAASPQLISSFLKFHNEHFCDLSIIAFKPDDINGYGRVFLNDFGDFEKIVEEKDCTQEQKRNKLCNSGFLVSKLGPLRMGVDKLNPTNSSGEYYLTDLPYILKQMSYKIGVFQVENSHELLGVNTQEQLKHLEKIIATKNNINLS